MPTPPITCIFHDSTSIVTFLATEAGRRLAGDLLIECAPKPALTYVLNLETPANYPGLAGILSGGDLATLAHSTDRLPAPIILAPGATVSRMAIRSALPLLQRPDDRL